MKLKTAKLYESHLLEKKKNKGNFWLAQYH